MDVVTTVITADTATKLIDLATLKSDLQISGTTDDAYLQRLIDRASAQVEQYCNRRLVVETVKDEFWPTRDPYPRVITGGPAPLQLTRWPIVTVTTVVENAITLAEGADYRVDTINGQLVRLGLDGYPRTWPVALIAVTYSAGYSPIPVDVQDACMRMASARISARERDPLLVSENIPGVREAKYWVATGTDAGNMSPDITDILDNYRVPVLR